MYTKLNKTIPLLYNAINLKKPYLILSYSEATYKLLGQLTKFYVKSIYRIAEFILVEFTYIQDISNIRIQVINTKTKKCFYSLKDLKYLIKFNKLGLISTSKGIFSLSEAINKSQGGILLCLISYNNI